jgi:glycosyltransferase involved in cell wall biosynthesis
LTAPGRRPSICLSMIVKDEADVIERLLASVRGAIDSWVICDTGSTDGTQDLIRNAMKDIPGALFERPWRNFGENRSELMELAAGRADYLLLLDADMTVTRIHTCCATRT